MWRLDEIDGLTEGVAIEAKAAQGKHGLGKLPESVWETYASFANTRGGHILLGVKEEADGRFTAIGIAEPERLRDEFWLAASDPTIVSRNILERGDLRIVTHEGFDMLIVRVPPIAPGETPIFINGDPLQGTYVRRGDGDFRCDPELVRQTLALKRKHNTEEE